jgi:hypothetical protein
MLNRISGKLSLFLEDFFCPPGESRYRWANWVWTLALFAGGIALWGVFFQWGKFPVTFHDWADVTAPRLYFLKDAVTQGIFPLHISNTSALGGVTDRYFSIPDVFFSPQALALAFLSITNFVLFNQFLMYAIGFLGLLWFQRKFKLSAMAFTVLFLLFNFNGHVLSHFAVGHDTWGGYFLFPWFAMLVITLLEGERSWKWVAKLALLLFAMLLQGSFHQVVWCLIFLGFLALAARKQFLPLAMAAIFTVIVSLFRLLPPSLLVSQFGKDYPFMGGYPTVGDIWSSLTGIRLPGTYTYPPFVQKSLGSWEFDLYIGLLGAAFLVIFGGYFWWKNRGEAGRYNALALPLVAVMILSIGDVYQLVRALHIPLLDGERVSSRMISLPFVFLAILATVEFQRWLNRVRFSTPIYIGQLAVLFIGAADLYRNFNAWILPNTHTGFNFTPVIPSEWFAVARVDPLYDRTLIVGAAGSLLGIGVLLYLVWAERRGRVRLALPGWMQRAPHMGTPVPVTARRRPAAPRIRPTPIAEGTALEPDGHPDPSSYPGKE